MQNQRRTTRQIFFLIIGLFYCYLPNSSAQEICNNGIDDDGNGLTDYQDETCTCDDLINTTLYIDFENYTCCPLQLSHDLCVNDGWMAVGNNTPDYYNMCGVPFSYSSGTLPQIPIPLPSGEGAMGFISSWNYIENIGGCLDYTLAAGETYDLDFSLGFHTENSWYSDSPWEVGIYGHPDCDVVGTGTGECLGDQGWTLIETISVTGTDSSWTDVSLTITPSIDLNAFSVTTSCGQNLGSNFNYHFLDNIIITGDFLESTYDLEDITMSGNCMDGITLNIDEDDGIIFQWYLDGVGIPGADSDTYILSNPLTEGEYSVYVDNVTSCGVTNVFDVSIDFESLVIEGNITNNPCFGNSLGLIDINSSDFNSPLDILWDTGDTVDPLSNLSDGDYTVTITDANGCYGTQTFTITSPPLLDALVLNIVHPTQDNPLGSASVQASGGTPTYTYNWSNGDTGDSNSTLPPGNYFITVTDANNCEVVVEVIINPVLIANTTITHETCFNACDGSLELEIEGGIPDYTINWNIGNGLEEYDLCADAYSITITDDVGTELILDIEIFGNPEIDIDATLGGDLCEGDEAGFIDLFVEGGAPDYQYNWSNGDTLQNLIDIPPGNYQVTVTDAEGCTAIEEYTIDAIQPFTYESNTLDAGCGGTPTGAVNLSFFVGADPFDFIWSNGAITQSITDVTSGIYTVTITDSGNCSQVADFTVNEDSDILVTETITNVSCPTNADGAISLNISGGMMPFMINWTTLGETEAIVENLPPDDYPVEILDANGCLWNGIFTVQADEAISIDEIVTDVICLDGNTGSIDITVNGGNAPFDFLWSNGEITEDLSNISSGNYNVVITDQSNCSSDFSFFVQNGYELSLNSQIKNAGCAQTPTGAIDISMIDGTSPYTYLWSNGQMTEDLEDIVSGNYSVTITDDNGCELFQDFIVPQDSDLEISFLVTDTRCPDSNDGNIDITIEIGTGPFIYNWSNGEMTEDVFDLEENMYSVTITDINNCELIESFNVESPSAPVYVIESTHPDCDMLNGSVTITSSSINQLDFSWSNGLMASMITNLGPDTYFVTITDGNDCEYFDQVTLIENDCNFTIDVSDAEIPCDESVTNILINIAGGTGPFEFELFNFQTVSTTNGTFNNAPFIIEDLDEGNYSLEIISADGLIANTNFIISQISNPEVSLTSLNDFNGFDIDCFNNSTGSILATITDGTPPYQILWNNNNSEQQIDNLSSGTYSLTVTDNNNCFTSSEITLTEPQLLVLDYTFNDPSCIDPLSGQIIASVEGGVPQYTFSTNGSAGTIESNFSNLPADTYDLGVTDMNGCMTSSIVDLIPPDEISVDLGEDQTIYLGESVTIEAILNLQSGDLESIVWIGIPNSLCINCTIVEFNPIETQTYEVLITDTNGCTATASVTIRVEIKINDFYVANIFSPNNDGINEWFFPQTVFDENQIIDYMYVFDRWGNRVFANEDFLINQPEMGWNGKLKNEKAVPGVYAYIISARLPNDQIRILSGNVTLVE